jgi:hypothetical protein
MFSSLHVTDYLQLTNDCHELKDMFGKCFIAGYRDVGASRLTVYAFGKKAPSDGGMMT